MPVSSQTPCSPARTPLPSHVIHAPASPETSAGRERKHQRVPPSGRERSPSTRKRPKKRDGPMWDDDLTPAPKEISRCHRDSSARRRKKSESSNDMTFEEKVLAILRKNWNEVIAPEVFEGVLELYRIMISYSSEDTAPSSDRNECLEATKELVHELLWELQQELAVKSEKEEDDKKDDMMPLIEEPQLPPLKGLENKPLRRSSTGTKSCAAKSPTKDLEHVMPSIESQEQDICIAPNADGRLASQPLSSSPLSTLSSGGRSSSRLLEITADGVVTTQKTPPGRSSTVVADLNSSKRDEVNNASLLDPTDSRRPASEPPVNNDEKSPAAPESGRESISPEQDDDLRPSPSQADNKDLNPAPTQEPPETSTAVAVVVIDRASAKIGRDQQDATGNGRTCFTGAPPLLIHDAFQVHTPPPSEYSHRGTIEPDNAGSAIKATVSSTGTVQARQEVASSQGVPPSAVDTSDPKGTGAIMTSTGEEEEVEPQAPEHGDSTSPDASGAFHHDDGTMNGPNMTESSEVVEISLLDSVGGRNDMAASVTLSLEWDLEDEADATAVAGRVRSGVVEFFEKMRDKGESDDPVKLRKETRAFLTITAGLLGRAGMKRARDNVSCLIEEQRWSKRSKEEMLPAVIGRNATRLSDDAQNPPWWERLCKATYAMVQANPSKPVSGIEGMTTMRNWYRAWQKLGTIERPDLVKLMDRLELPYKESDRGAGLRKRLLVKAFGIRAESLDYRLRLAEIVDLFYMQFGPGVCAMLSTAQLQQVKALSKSTSAMLIEEFPKWVPEVTRIARIFEPLVRCKDGYNLDPYGDDLSNLMSLLDQASRDIKQPTSPWLAIRSSVSQAVGELEGAQTSQVAGGEGHIDLAEDATVPATVGVMSED